MQVQNIFFPLFLALLAGLSTVIGSLVFLFIKEFKKSHLSFLMGLSAGVMVYLSFMELLPYSVLTIGIIKTNLLFFIGFAAIACLDFLIPHSYIQEHLKGESEKQSSLLRTGLFVALGLTIHNFPEGIAVAFSTLANVKFGLLLAFATAVHNIPEGLAIAIPIYYATKNKGKAFKYSFLSGIAEPIGAILAVTILWPFLNNVFLSYIFAIVAGIMVFISFDELLPSCFENNYGHTAISGIAVGMAIMAFSILLLY